MTYQKTQYRLTAALGLAVAVVASGMGGCAAKPKPLPPIYSGVEQSGNASAALKESHKGVRGGIEAALKALDQ